jgi:translation initiation factor IF-3
MRATNAGLDLVEIAPNSKPPVCRIMDYGKYMYEQSKKAKLAKKKQHTVQLKEMRYRPKIEEHDYRFKTNHVREFLEQGNKVRVFVRFSGREMAHIDYGRKILDRIAEEMADISTIGQEPKLDGRRMTMILNPKTSALKAKKKRSQDAEDKDKSVGGEKVQEDSDR